MGGKSNERSIASMLMAQRGVKPPTAPNQPGIGTLPGFGLGDNAQEPQDPQNPKKKPGKPSVLGGIGLGDGALGKKTLLGE